MTRTPPSFSRRTQACPSLVNRIVPPSGYGARQTYSSRCPALLAGSDPPNPPLAYGPVPSSPGRGPASGQAEHAGQGAGRRAARVRGEVERGRDVPAGGEQPPQFA